MSFVLWMAPEESVMGVLPLSSDWDAVFDEYVGRRSDALIYHGTAYQRFLARILDCRVESLVCAADDGTVRGVFPLLSKEGRFGIVYNSLPFYGSNGGVLADDAAAAGELTAAYARLIEREGVASATVVGNPLAVDDAAFAHIGFTHKDSRIGQFTALESIRADSMESFHYKTRNAIRKAQKLGIEIRTENAGALRFLYDLHRANIAALGGVPKPECFFSCLPHMFREGQDYEVHVARVDGNDVAAMLLLYFGTTVEYYVPAILERWRSSQAMSLLVYTGMCRARAAGRRLWNWGGTWPSQEGVRRFKGRWGSYERLYEYRTTVRNPDLLNQSLRELIAEYPYFYVVPAAALGTDQ